MKRILMLPGRWARRLRVAIPIVVPIALVWLIAPGECGAAGPVSAQRLRCEYLINPLGIDAVRPRLSWIMQSDGRGQRQAAYQILVSSSEEKLRRNRGDLWNSGRVATDQSVHVVYGGRPLPSRQRCHWKVRVWDKDGKVSAYSEPAYWQMGLLNRSDWHGQWIGFSPRAALAKADQSLPLDAAFWIWFPEGEPARDAPVATRFFRRRVTLPAAREIKSARLRIAADNKAAIFINGEEVGRSEDSWTKFDVFDVRRILHPGENVLAVSVANTFSAAGLAARLEIEFDSGPPLTIVTDKSWTTTDKEVPGWQAAQFEEAGWLPAKEVVKVGGGLWGAVPSVPATPAPPAPHLRRAFQVKSKLRRATLSICGLGYYELRLNGRKVGDHILDPGYTRYDKRALYVTYDVTPYLQAGRNALGVVLGSGWYDAHVLGVWDFEKAPWRARPRLLLELRLDYGNGRSERVVSDGSWKAATGPILFDSIYAGEVYDARLEKTGWDTAHYSDASWQNAQVVPAPKGVLAAQMMPPIKVQQTLVPVKLTQPRPGVWLYDMGQNFAGFPQLFITGPAGAKVVMACGEKLHADGTLDQSNIAGFVKGRDPSQFFQTDTYILKGAGREVYEPRFTYHGFRYVEVSGFPGQPTLDNLRGRVVHSAMPPAGRFECSNPLLNRIQQNTLWSYRSNFHGIPTDCPHREKNGWMGDAHLAAEQGMYNFDAAANYTKWLNDIYDEQQPNGALPGIVPTSGWGYAWGNGPAWDSAYPLITWYLYQYYGDTRILQIHYDRLRRYVDYLTGRAKNGIVGFGLGDWVAPKTQTPVEVTDTGYYYADTVIVARAAALLGKTGDARKYSALAENIRKAFNAKFFDAATGQYANGSLTALSCALFQGLTEPSNHDAVVQNLVAEVAKQGDHMDVGILGAKYLLNTLTVNGRADVAYRLATQTTPPSYGHWIERGATTLWEDWGGGASLNHIMFGDISAWFYKVLAGINAATPGFKRIVIKPHVLGDLTFARASYDSIHGRIVSDWKVENRTFALSVTIPANTTATVYIPAAGKDKVMEGGMAADRAEGVRFRRMEEGYALFAVGSGTYKFTAESSNK